MVQGLTYSQYTTLIAQLAVTQVTDPNFVALIPSMIDIAELRVCQDLDLLFNDVANTGFACMPNSRTVPVPSNTFVTIEQVNVLTPVGSSNPTFATRNPCTPTTKEVLDMLWPSAAGATVPNKFAVLGQFNILFGPWPDAAYGLEVVGTARPLSLSATNPTTFISLNLPHIFVAASMVYISAYQRNFGRMSDDPQMAVSWESFYKSMLASSAVEEARKKFESVAWSAKSPSSYALPNRGPTTGKAS